MWGVSMQAEVSEVRERRRPGLGLLAAATLYAWIAAGFSSFTLASALAVGFPGVAGVLLAASDWPRERVESARRIGPMAAIWAVWVVVLSLWELYAFLMGSTPGHPTISVLLDGPLEVHVIRAAAFFGWLALGWRVLRR